jgi:hypothetical protein
MLTDSPQTWLMEALATRDLERLQANMPASGMRIGEARKHVRSARMLAGDDPALAIAACHDAIRKAVTGHMLAAGLRPRGGEGAHRIVLAYARHVLGTVITADDLGEADGIRRDRALAEYGDYPSSQFSADHVNAAADVAERIVNAVATELARRSKGKR